MLAQNFKSAADLEITDAEQGALIKVLGMLEREEMKFSYVEAPGTVVNPVIENGFNMGPYLKETECGTIGCIAGWAHLASGRRIFPFVISDGGSAADMLPIGLFDLFHCSDNPIQMNDRYRITPSQAATALRSYLTTGEANWAEALAV